MEDKIVIVSQLNRTTLRKGIKNVLKNAKAVKAIHLLGIGLVIFSIGLFVYMKGSSYAPLLMLFVGFVFIYFPNIMAFFSINRFQDADQVFEKLTYTFKLEEIKIKGETFEGYLDWIKLKEVIETKEFFLIYLSAIGASILPKEDFTEAQAADFRDLITTIPGLKNNILD